jgi:hypothetical protein
MTRFLCHPSPVPVSHEGLERMLRCRRSLSFFFDQGRDRGGASTSKSGAAERVREDWEVACPSFWQKRCDNLYKIKASKLVMNWAHKE